MMFLLIPSIRPVAADYGSRRSQNNLNIEPERPRPDVLEIQPNHIVELCPASAGNLP
jgi:hypothetical protein